MNLATVFWLLFAGSALVSGLALWQSLRILLYKESRSSSQKSQQESYLEQMNGYGTLSPESVGSKPKLQSIDGKNTRKTA